MGWAESAQVLHELILVFYALIRLSKFSHALLIEMLARISHQVQDCIAAR